MVTFRAMIKTGLEFAPGTTNDCKRLVLRLFQPSDILGSYRTARQALKTGDLVLVTQERDPSGFEVMPRAEYVGKVRRAMGSSGARMMHTLGVANKSAHGVVQMPFDSEALWLIVLRGRELPIMCVLYAVPYKDTAVAS